MGFAISHLTAQNLTNIQSDCEYQLTIIMNQLQRLANEEASITMQQMSYSQSYIAKQTPMKKAKLLMVLSNGLTAQLSVQNLKLNSLKFRQKNSN